MLHFQVKFVQKQKPLTMCIVHHRLFLYVLFLFLFLVVYVDLIDFRPVESPRVQKYILLTETQTLH